MHFTVVFCKTSLLSWFFFGKTVLRNASTHVQDVMILMVCVNMDPYLAGRDTSASKVLHKIIICQSVNCSSLRKLPVLLSLDWHVRVLVPICITVTPNHYMLHSIHYYCQSCKQLKKTHYMYNVKMDLIKSGLTRKYKLLSFTPKHLQLFFFRNYFTGFKCKVFSYASECSVV